jgi:hypothetical protein
MANVLTVVWFIIGWTAMQTGLMVWLALMLPQRVGRARERVETAPVRTFFVGAAFWIVTVLFAVNLIKQGRPGPVQLFGWLTAGPMLAASAIGGAAFAQIVSERIRERSPQTSPLAALAVGGLCTAISGLLPVIGWFVFLPIVGFMSVGAGLSALLRKKPAQHPEPALDEDHVHVPVRSLSGAEYSS